MLFFFFFSSRRRHTRCSRDWSSDVCSSDLPFSAKNMGPRDDHVNLLRASFHRAADFRDAFREGRKTRGEPRRNRRNSYAAALQSAPRGLHETVIDTNGGYFQVELSDSEPLPNFLLDGLAGFPAQAAHALVGIVAGESRQVHAGNGAQEPSRLPFLLYRPPRDEGLGAAFHRAQTLVTRRTVKIGRAHV